MISVKRYMGLNRDFIASLSRYANWRLAWQVRCFERVESLTFEELVTLWRKLDCPRSIQDAAFCSAVEALETECAHTIYQEGLLIIEDRLSA